MILRDTDKVILLTIVIIIDIQFLRISRKKKKKEREKNSIFNPKNFPGEKLVKL